MPEVTIYEYSHTRPGEHNIWMPNELSIMDPVTQATSK